MHLLRGDFKYPGEGCLRPCMIRTQVELACLCFLKMAFILPPFNILTQRDSECYAIQPSSNPWSKLSSCISQRIQVHEPCSKNSAHDLESENNPVRTNIHYEIYYWCSGIFSDCLGRAQPVLAIRSRGRVRSLSIIHNACPFHIIHPANGPVTKDWRQKRINL